MLEVHLHAEDSPLGLGFPCRAGGFSLRTNCTARLEAVDREIDQVGDVATADIGAATVLGLDTEHTRARDHKPASITESCLKDAGTEVTIVMPVIVTDGRTIGYLRRSATGLVNQGGVVAGVVMPVDVAETLLLAGVGRCSVHINGAFEGGVYEDRMGGSIGGGDGVFNVGLNLYSVDVAIGGRRRSGPRLPRCLRLPWG